MLAPDRRVAIGLLPAVRLARRESPQELRLAPRLPGLHPQPRRRIQPPDQRPLDRTRPLELTPKLGVLIISVDHGRSSSRRDSTARFPPRLGGPLVVYPLAWTGGNIPAATLRSVPQVVPPHGP